MTQLPKVNVQIVKPHLPEFSRDYGMHTEVEQLRSQLRDSMLEQVATTTESINLISQLKEAKKEQIKMLLDFASYRHQTRLKHNSELIGTALIFLALGWILAGALGIAQAKSEAVQQVDRQPVQSFTDPN